VTDARTPFSAQTPFVVLGDDWGRHVSTLQHLFKHVIPEHPVVWVESFGHRIPRLRVVDVRRAAEKMRAMARPRRPATDERGPAAVLAPRALPWHTARLVRSANTWSITHDVRRALARIAPGEPPVLVMATPTLPELVGTLRERAAIYFCMDDYGELPDTTASMLEPLEALLLERVDAVVATARRLVMLKCPKSGRAYHLPQGVNYDHFATPRSCPPELASLPRPILGFAGGVSPCCDFELLRTVANAMPNASVALVGPVMVDLGAERLPSNVHILGKRSYAELPAYVQAFDVGLIPYLLNDWTLSVDPLKLLEYLAAGIPVVTTPLPEVQKYASVVSQGSTPAAFLAAVRGALATREPERASGRETAARNTWSRRARQFLEIVAGSCGRTAEMQSMARDHAIASPRSLSVSVNRC
jgi:glycosyltransferase involved in cell wall biosynthesis